jgi:hypothetical protein
MRIALVTEGKSEHWIIKHLIERYFKETEIFFRQVQPQIIDDTQESIGGWLEVLKFCGRTDDIKAVLIETDYLVIQIDTDESQNINFEVSHTKQGSTEKPHDELYADVIEKIKGLINNEVLIEYSNKIVFAVCIHTIECWLLPIYFTKNHKKTTQNCLEKLSMELRKRNLNPVPPKEQREKRKTAYDSILRRNWRKRNDIVKSANHNVGFRKFVESLDMIQIEIAKNLISSGSSNESITKATSLTTEEIEQLRIEIANNLISLGIDNELIAKATNLTFEQIEQLRSEKG